MVTAIILTVLVLGVVISGKVWLVFSDRSIDHKKKPEIEPEPEPPGTWAKRKHDQRTQHKEEWDKEYISLLPDHERPDYILPEPEDFLDDTVTVNTMVGAAWTRQIYKKSDGRSYTISTDYDENSRVRQRTLIHRQYIKDVTDCWDQMREPKAIEPDRYSGSDVHDTAGHCITCGKFKGKTDDGHYVCRSEYYRKGEWRHK